PGRRSTILYCPFPSVVTDRVFSIKTSLDASTVTPGSTAPDVSLTTPTIALCAWATLGSSTRQASAAARKTADLRIIRASIWLLPIGERTKRIAVRPGDYQRRQPIEPLKSL